MTQSEIHYQRGIPEALRTQAAHLYDAAFGAKLGLAVRSPSKRIELLARSFQLPFAFCAVQDDRLVGLAGFHTADGSLTGGIGYTELVEILGLLGGSWAALIFSLYERKPAAGELLMDGISVHPDMRSQGVGSRLLSELAVFAAQEGYDVIRLDVIDTNSGARHLYERKGFTATKTEQFAYLRWLLGFGASTTMILPTANASTQRKP